MNYIYADNSVCKWHADFIPNTKVYTDLTTFIELDSDNQTAIFQVPYPCNDVSEFKQRLNQVIDHCQHVILLISELHAVTVDFFQQHQHSKVTYFVCGIIDQYPTAQWMDWFITSSHFYKTNPNALAQLTPYQVKPKAFDILLGRVKPHRTAIYNYINNNQLADQVVMTYLKGNDQVPLQEQDQSSWIWEETNLEIPTNPIVWTVTPVSYCGQGMSLSQVIPIGIYNQTAYSLVAETNYDNHYSFYTEKIVKPILAERLFLVASGQHYLKNLRSLGFQTFDGIIDESYDLVADHTSRFRMVCEQINYLTTQPQERILKEIQSITKHNKHVMLTTDWYGSFSSQLKKIITD